MKAGLVDTPILPGGVTEVTVLLEDRRELEPRTLSFGLHSSSVPEVSAGGPPPPPPLPELSFKPFRPALGPKRIPASSSLVEAEATLARPVPGKKTVPYRFKTRVFSDMTVVTVFFTQNFISVRVISGRYGNRRREEELLRGLDYAPESLGKTSVDVFSHYYLPPGAITISDDDPLWGRYSDFLTEVKEVSKEQPLPSWVLGHIDQVYNEIYSRLSQPSAASLLNRARARLKRSFMRSSG